MCKVLNVSRGGYYKWLAHKPSPREKRRAEIAEFARRSHADSQKIYGYRKVFEDMAEIAPELLCAPETLRRIMAENGLFSCVKRKHRYRPPTPDSQYQYADNLLERDFTATAPGQKWVADITYIRTHEGWLYLAAVMDLFSRRIVGWSMSDEANAALVCTALESAIMANGMGQNLVHHSDRGIQYSSDRFQKLLAEKNISCSMSRKGDPWDNACQESFFGKLKSEWIRGRIYRTHEEAKQDIFRYIEIFYNRHRRHAALGYMTPVQFEESMAQKTG